MLAWDKTERNILGESELLVGEKLNSTFDSLSILFDFTIKFENRHFMVYIYMILYEFEQ